MATLGVVQGQLERAGDLRAGDLPDPSALEKPLDGEHDRPLAIEVTAGHHDPVVARGDHTLRLQVWGLQPLKRADQLPKRAVVQQRGRPLAGGELGKLGPCRRWRGHDRLSSTAWASRRATVPGVAPASLISMAAARSSRAKKRSSTARQTSPNPSALVRTVTWACSSSEGSSSTSRSPEPTTPTCARCDTGCEAG